MVQGRWAISAVVALSGAIAFASGAYAGSLKDYSEAEPVSTPKSTVTFSGSDWAKDSSYFYSGVIYALNRDLGRDGVVLRGFAGVPMFEYDGGAETIDGDGIQGDLMIGYMWQRPFATFSAFVGVEYQDYDLTPDDPTNKVRGSETGFKLAADLASAYESPLYFNLSGSYSTAFDSYWAQGRIGYNAGRFVIGPEVIAMGSEGFDARRVGGFATLRFELSPAISSEITVYAGHQFVDDEGGESSRGGEGTYGGVGFTLVF